MQDFEGKAKVELLWRVVTFFLQEDINNFPAGKRFCFADKDPCSPLFRNPAFSCAVFGRFSASRPHTQIQIYIPSTLRVSFLSSSPALR